MKKLIFSILLLPISLFADPVRFVTVDTNGVILNPTNFADANGLTGGGGGGVSSSQVTNIANSAVGTYSNYVAGSFVPTNRFETNAAAVQTQIDGKLSSVTASNILYVSKSGSDANGARGRIDKHFLTLEAAQTNAQSGDLIYVLPGTYTPGTALGKNGVNWFFQDALVTKSSGHIFTDGGSAMSFSISGNGKFSSGFDTAFSFENASSDIRIRGRWFYVAEGAGFASVALFVNGATVTMEADEYIRSDDYDGVWVSTGTVTLRAPLIQGADQAVESGGATTVIAERLVGASNPVEYTGGSLTIDGAKLSSAGNGVIVGSTNLTLKDCVVEVSGTNSLTATTNRSVTVSGTLTANKPLFNVTLNGGLFIFNGTNTAAEIVATAGITLNGSRITSWPSGGTGSGETNTASNRGGGYPVYDSKSGVDLRFNTFTNDATLSVSSNANLFTWGLSTLWQNKILTNAANIVVASNTVLLAAQDYADTKYGQSQTDNANLGTTITNTFMTLANTNFNSLFVSNGISATQVVVSNASGAGLVVESGGIWVKRGTSRFDQDTAEISSNTTYFASGKINIYKDGSMTWANDAAGVSSNGVWRGSGAELTNISAGSFMFATNLTPASATNITLDVSVGQAVYKRIIATNNVNFLSITNTVSDGPGAFAVKIIAAGADRTISWPTNWPTLYTNGLTISGAYFTATVSSNRQAIFSGNKDAGSSTTNILVQGLSATPFSY